MPKPGISSSPRESRPWSGSTPWTSTATRRPTGVDVAAAGLTWFIVGKTKLQVNYEHTRNEAGAVVNRAFLVQFQLGY